MIKTWIIIESVTYLFGVVLMLVYLDRFRPRFKDIKGLDIIAALLWPLASLLFAVQVLYHAYSAKRVSRTAVENSKAYCDKCAHGGYPRSDEDDEACDDCDEYCSSFKSIDDDDNYEGVNAP